MTKWEYLTTPLPPPNQTAILNDWGKDGWELVTIETNAMGGLVAFFKRPLEG